MRALFLLALAVSALDPASPAAPQRITRAPDAVAPAIRVASPSSGTRIETFTPEIEIEYDDEGSGVAVVSFKAVINGRDHSASFEHHSRGATGKIAVSNPLPLGENTLVVEVRDRAGNIGRAEATFVNAAGGWLAALADPGVGPRRHIELVLDASGSMSEKLLDNTRMAVAKGAVKALVKALPADVPLGLRVFRDCAAIEQLIPIGNVDPAAFSATVDKIQPTGGTPIVASLLQSFQMLSQLQEVERVAVLVTDGGESCNGAMKDAVQRARELSIRVIVISFDIKERTVNEQLIKLAEDTGGAYFNAQDGAELREALERSVLKLGFGVHDGQGRRVAEGEVNGPAVMLPVGTYRVRFDVASARIEQEVRIGPLGTATIRLRQAGTTVVPSVEHTKQDDKKE
jgi:hypothetical protein